ncbi:MAG TPA: glycosyltransferase, partial [Bacteroidetes bacterium]|nr:glycosyltransferase [Bacteroidota bacterium]
MAKITKKVKMTKKEIKHDDIQDKIVDSLGLMKQYAKHIIIGALIIFVIVVMVNSYVKNNRKKEKSVSIIISVYNGGKVFQECLESLSKIDYKNFELVIVNDNSTD